MSAAMSGDTFPVSVMQTRRDTNAVTLWAARCSYVLCFGSVSREQRQALDPVCVRVPG